MNWGGGATGVEKRAWKHGVKTKAEEEVVMNLNLSFNENPFGKPTGLFFFIHYTRRRKSRWT